MWKIMQLTAWSISDVPYYILYDTMYHIHIRCNSLVHSPSHNRIQSRTFQSRGDFSQMDGFLKNSQQDLYSKRFWWQMKGFSKMVPNLRPRILTARLCDWKGLSKKTAESQANHSNLYPRIHWIYLIYSDADRSVLHWSLWRLHHHNVCQCQWWWWRGWWKYRKDWCI